MPESYACVSVRQPWADLLAAGIKPVENRSWSCAHRGPLLIHAGKTWGRDEQAAYDDLLERALHAGHRRMVDVLARSQSRLGGLVGMTVMVGSIDEDEWLERGGGRFNGLDQWFVGPFGWLQSQARVFDPFIPFKGQQGLFRIPADVVKHYESRRAEYEAFLG